MNHGAPDAAVRHVGDLGNIETEADDEDTEFVIVDDEISLDPGSDVSILGTSQFPRDINEKEPIQGFSHKPMCI